MISTEMNRSNFAYPFRNKGEAGVEQCGVSILQRQLLIMRSTNGRFNPKG